MMDYDKLIKRLKNAAGGSEGIKMCQDAALRSVSREQVEKVWRGKWQRGTKYWVCSRCGRSHTFVKSFCPNCGAPMTDEAVEMVMERLEALNAKD